ncbi:hypothetical protein JCM8547_004860 [Rhodosporidiobolus lusitaniae]
MSWLQGLFGPDLQPLPPSHSPSTRSPSPDKASSSAPLPAHLLSSTLLGGIDDSVSSPWPTPAPRQVVRVAVLLDGNVDFFSTPYLGKSARGGRSAALDLRSAVYAYVVRREQSRFSSSSSSSSAAPLRPPEVQVLAKLFLDQDELEKSLGASGKDLRKFVQGFNGSSLPFSMSDVGRSRGAADEAIKGHLPFLLPMVDLLILGDSSTGGYAPDLLRIDPSVVKEKVVLLRTRKYMNERVHELELEEVLLPGIFEERVVDEADAPLDSVFSPHNPPSSFTAPPPAPAPLPPFFSAPSPFFPTPTPPPAFHYSQLGTPGAIAALERAASASLPSSSVLNSPARSGTPSIFGAVGQPSSQQATPPPQQPVFGPAVPAHPPSLAAAFLGLEVTEPAAPPSVAESAPSPTKPAAPLPTRAATPPPPAPVAAPPVSSPQKPTAAPSLPPVSTTTTTASSTQVDPKFRPLVSLLHHYQSALSQPTPRRADVGQKLKNSHPTLYSSWREYVAEAERRGLVELLEGVGGVKGGERIALRKIGGGGESAELGRTGSSSSKTSASPVKRPTASTFSSGPAPRDAPAALHSTRPLPSFPSPPPSPPPLTSPFPDPRPLLTLLLTLLSSTPPKPRPLRSYVCDLLRKENAARGPGKWFFDQTAVAKSESLREYLERLAEEEWVRKGRGEGVGGEWLELVDPEKAKAFLAAPPPRAASPPPAPLPTASHSSPSTPKPTASTSPRHIPSHLLPLLLTISQSDYPSPHWTTVGASLNRMRPKPYAEGGFKAFVEEAREGGWIRTGRVEGKEGCYWMKMTPEALNALAAHSSSSSLPPPIPSTTSFPSSSLSPPTSSIPPKFLPLLRFLLSSPLPAPHWTHIGASLNRHKPRLYEEGGLKGYMMEAVREEVVEVGKVEGKEASWWARLTPAMKDFLLPDSNEALSAQLDSSFGVAPLPAGAKERSHSSSLASHTTSATATTSSAPSSIYLTVSPHPPPTLIPPFFLPLLTAILTVPFPRPFMSQVGHELNKLPAWTMREGGEGRGMTFKEYVEEAVVGGVVERGRGEKTGQDWILIRTGLSLPAQLQSLREQASTPRPPTQPASTAPPAPPIQSHTLFPPLSDRVPTNGSSLRSFPLPDFSAPPIISSSTSAASSSTNAAPSPATLERWRTLAPLHPFAPLILVLSFLPSSPPPSLSKVRSILEQFPASSLPGEEEEAPLERVLQHGGAKGEGLFGFVARAARAGVVKVGEEGVELREEWRGWEEGQ